MTELDHISDQLNRTFNGNAWYGPSVKEVLEGVPAKTAARKPLSGAHSIWELVHHLTSWTDIGRRRAQGEIVELTPELDWPPVNDASEGAWNWALRRLETAQRELVDLLPALAKAQLDAPPVKGAAPLYLLLNGIVQHFIYHAGQLAILKQTKQP